MKRNQRTTQAANRSPSFTDDVPASFVSVTRKIGDLAKDLCVLEWVGDGSDQFDSERAGQADTSKKTFSICILDFTGLLEEKEAIIRTRTYLQELERSLKIKPDDFWGPLYQFAGHVTRSEFERAQKVCKAMKDEIVGAIRERRSFGSFASRLRHPPLPPALRTAIEEACNDPQLARARKTSKDLLDEMKKTRRQYFPRGNFSIHDAERQLVQLFMKPCGDIVASACDETVQLLKIWVGERLERLVPSPKSLEHRCEDMTVHKKNRVRRSARTA